MHHLVRRIENALRYKEVAMLAFIDGEVAFRTHIEPNTVEMISRMLECRIFRSRLAMELVTIKTNRSCPQRGVLSPLLWSLVV
jgi:hypothetical protein